MGCLLKLGVISTVDECPLGRLLSKRSKTGKRKNLDLWKLPIDEWRQVCFNKANGKNYDGIMHLLDRFREPAVAASRRVEGKAVCFLS